MEREREMVREGRERENLEDNNRSIVNDKCCRMGHESVDIEGTSQLAIIASGDGDN